MSIAKFESLSKLTAGLSKSEKRHFVLFANRVQGKQEKVFLKLFEALEQFPGRSEADIFKKLSPLTSSQFTNVKRNLYTQLLNSLQLLNTTVSRSRPAQRNYDKAHLLFTRGLIQESLVFLDLAKSQIKQSDLQLSINLLELHKNILLSQNDRQHTRPESVAAVIAEMQAKQKEASELSHYSGVALLAIAQLQKWGFVRNAREDDFYESSFRHMLHGQLQRPTSATGRRYWHLAWAYHQLKQLKFPLVYRQTSSILQDLPDTGGASESRLVFIRAFHLKLTACFFLGQLQRHRVTLSRFQEYIKQSTSEFNEPERSLAEYYAFDAQLNSSMLSNKLSSELSNKTSFLHPKVSGKSYNQKDILLHYKLGVMHSYSGHYDEALGYFDLVQQNSSTSRMDVINYARLAAVICHYRLNNFRLVLNLLTSIRSSFEQSDRMTPVIELLISFLRKGSRAMNFGIQELVDLTRHKLELQRRSRFGKVDFLYYDFTALMNSINDNSTVEKTRKIKL